LNELDLYYFAWLELSPINDCSTLGPLTGQ